MGAVWRDTVRLISNGESVDDKTTNKPLIQLTERTDYLKARIDEAALGEGLILFSETIASTVSEGDVVYVDTGNNQYAPALAEAQNDSLGTLRTGARAYAEGVVIRKLSSTTGDILIRGRYKNITLTDANGAILTPGRYYLSGTDAGKLVSQRPSVGVFVCTITDGDDTDTYDILVNPTPREVLEDHIHYRIELEIDPAGQAMCADGQYVEIIYPTTSEEGWLPSDHAFFQGNAPLGAHFGYNLWKNPQLAGLWPPQPLRSAYLELNGVGVSQDDFVVDENGIWWMTNCNTKVPWEADSCLSSSMSLVQSSSSGAAVPGECAPRVRRLVLWFTKMVAKTDQACVTGLKAVSPLLIECCSEADASGYYQARIDLSLDMQWPRTAGVSGGEVIKGILNNDHLQVGYVAEGIKGSGLISASGTHTLSGGYATGLVTLQGLDPTSITRSIDVLLVDLQGAEEDVYEGVVPFTGLPSGRDSAFIGRVRIPTLSMTNPKLRLELWFGMPVAGTPPTGVSIAYAKVDDAGNTAESSSSLFGGGFGTLPTAFSTAVDLSLEDVGARVKGEYFNRVAISNLSIASEQLFFFRLRRSGTNGYTGSLAVVNMVATIYEG